MPLFEIQCVLQIFSTSTFNRMNILSFYLLVVDFRCHLMDNCYLKDKILQEQLYIEVDFTKNTKDRKTLMCINRSKITDNH